MLLQSQVEEILKPYFTTFAECFRGGMADYSTKYTDTRIVHSARTRANIFRDHVVDHARRNFEGKEFARPVETPNGLFCIEIDGKGSGIDGRLLIRFKKLNKKLLASNVLTKQAADFNEQKDVFSQPVQMPLFDGLSKVEFSLPTNLNAGYIPNELWTGLEGMFVTCPNGKRSIAWFANIGDSTSADRQGCLIPLPIETTVEESARQRVRVKGTAKKKKAASDDAS
jgi:hypothetical protein